VGCARATHDDVKNVDFITRPVLANGIGEGVYLSRIQCAVWEKLRSVQYFHSLRSKFLIEEYPRRPFVWPTNLGSRSRIKSGLWAGGLNTEGSISSMRMAWHEVRELVERLSSASTRRVGM
jgi:hypothetical protein